MAADAEMCMLAADTMEALGIKRGDYVVKVNNRKILDGAMDAIGIGGDENAGKRLTVLRAVDKLDRLGANGVRQLLGEGRKDESGDFTKGASLDSNQIKKIETFLTAREIVQAQVFAYAGDSERLAKTAIANKKSDDEFGIALKIAGWLAVSFANSKLVAEGTNELSEIARLTNAAGYGGDRIRIDPSVVRGLEYYTGPVYEIELTFETKDEKGRPVRFGSVGGGWRYDGLVSRFMGQPVPATGFSIGVSRLQAALAALGKLGDKRAAGPVLVTVFGAESVPACQAFTAMLRNAGIRAELYLGNPKHGIGQQLKYADRRGSPCAVIQGPDEKAKGEVQIRDLIAGAAPSDVKERDAYLKQQAQAQVAVKESELVEAVCKLLNRHGIG
jgi:histidyl-tRNA synthetase